MKFNLKKGKSMEDQKEKIVQLSKGLKDKLEKSLSFDETVVPQTFDSQVKGYSQEHAEEYTGEKAYTTLEKHNIGIVFKLDDHEPPHVHAQYPAGSRNPEVDIPYNILDGKRTSGQKTKGSLKNKVENEIKSYIKENKEQLLKEWNLCQSSTSTINSVQRKVNFSNAD